VVSLRKLTPPSNKRIAVSSNRNRCRIQENYDTKSVCQPFFDVTSCAAKKSTPDIGRELESPASVPYQQCTFVALLSISTVIVVSVDHVGRVCVEGYRRVRMVPYSSGGRLGLGLSLEPNRSSVHSGSRRTGTAGGSVCHYVINVVVHVITTNRIRRLGINQIRMQVDWDQSVCR
jgi:hypothetical protein